MSIECWFVDILVKESRYIFSLEAILEAVHVLTRKRLTENAKAFIIEKQLTCEHIPQQKYHHPREWEQVFMNNKAGLGTEYSKWSMRN